MEITNMPHSKTNLNFQPAKAWPAVLPAIEWHGVRLCGWDSTLSPIDRSEAPLHEVLVAIYPQLSLGELARLWRKANLSSLGTLNWAELFRNYGYRLSEDLTATLDLLANLPMEFQNFIDTKGFGVRDLAPLRAAQSSGDLLPHLLRVVSLNPSKVEATKAIELISELAMLGKLPAVAASDTVAWSDYFQQLFSARYPLATQEKNRSDAFWNQISWPAGVQAQFVRRGDRTGVEVKYFARTLEELAAKSKKLTDLTTGELDV